MLYRLIVNLRNLLYDHHILPSYTSPLQTISVGNLAVGGTGKTPHSELIIRKLLIQGKRVAYLSRGYKRTSKGLLVATESSDSFDLGDEALQVHRKFPEITVVVDADRTRALKYLETQDIDVVVLDDAFQHRKVTPSTSILLIDYSMDIAHESLLPFGRLREPISGIRRADTVVFTKCPSDITEADKNARIKLIQKYGITDIRFSKITYEPLPIVNCQKSLVLLTAIENPTPLANHLKGQGYDIELHKYRDHHRFTEAEIAKAKATGKPIITTEKDWCRMNCPDGFVVARIKSEIIC